jgi:hypothetical protein
VLAKVLPKVQYQSCVALEMRRPVVAMIQFLKARRARKAAIATICPLVDRSRWKLRGIPEAAWLDPYMIGFMSMLITLVAKEEAHNLGVDALGVVQVEAWKAITNSDIDDIGGEICLLSAGRDSAFQSGCENAALLFQTLKIIDKYGGDVGVVTEASRENNEAAALMWARMFEDRIRSCAAVE